jgi:hypothetical protein
VVAVARMLNFPAQQSTPVLLLIAEAVAGVAASA